VSATKEPGDPLELVLPDHSRIALHDEVTIGRDPISTLRLSDPSVSRRHARISPAAGGAVMLADAGSSYGTWLDGHRLRAPARLHAGSSIRVGNQELLVDRRREDSEAGRTIVVPQNATATVRFGSRPRMRSGYALKRLAATEGDRRWVLKDLRSPRYLRLSEADAELVGLLDGERPLAELVSAVEQRLGASGPARLMLLLAALGERGFLSGPAEAAADPPAPRRLQRLFAPRQVAWPGAGALFDRLYRAGGRLLFSRTAQVALGALAIAGAVVFVALIARRYGTPFVVASKLGIGGLVFIFGRFAVAAAHETAHGLTMAAYGRRVREAGLKLVLVFPYVYVDTSDAWFEPRHRRIAVSAAGPASDLCVGGLFSLMCAALGPGALRDVFFQLAFGAYVAAFFNLNPLIERDGYHILVDVLREPGLRRRAREQLARQIAGIGGAATSAVLTRYALFGLAWSAVGAIVAVGVSLHYEPVFARLAPEPVVWALMGALWVGLFVPVLAMAGLPAIARLRARRQ
jgi:putative peptide zinc metalloprotease protein